MSSLQKSIWSIDELPSVHHCQSFNDDSKQNIDNNQLSINAWSNETLDDGINNSNKLGSPIRCFIRCCILGSLLTGITLAIVLTLWLTNGNITSQASSITTSDILTITTTTTETTTTTSVTSPLTLPPAPCGISSPYSANILLYITNPTTIVYTCYAFIWTSSVSGTVNLHFQFRQDTNYWNLDEVNVYAVGGTQMLANGGFETGSLTPWIRTPPSGGCVATPGAQVVTLSSYLGNYNLQDRCKSQIDKISQSFMVNAAQPYLVSFYLKTGSLSPFQSVNVSIS